ncbi:MAG: GIN domain-containing protein [Omnitrophica WOR_2 bacterium]|jgi:hypothetical protein
MKSLFKNYRKSSVILAMVAFLLPLFTLAQTEGSGNIKKENRPLPEFKKIEVGSAFTVILSQGDPAVTVETDDNLGQNIETLVDEGVLTINSSGIKNPTSLKVYVTAPDITDIELTGAARLESKGVLNYPVMHISAAGASRVNIEINSQELTTEVSGASRITLRGSATSHTSEVSGASSVNALLLKTVTTTAEVSGAGKMSVFAKNQINADLRDAGSLKYFDNPDIKKAKQSGSSVINLNNPDNAVPKESDEDLGDVEIKVFEDGDSTFIKLGQLNLHVDENGDNTKIGIGQHDLEIDDEGNVKFKKHHKEKFDGHWGGFDIGVNGLLNSDNTLSSPSGYDYMDLKMEKSINIGINIFEQNFNLITNKFGVTTGMGLEWNNYRLQDHARVFLDDKLSGYLYEGSDTNFVKSKFVTSYLTLPLMLEYQTNSHSKINSFHIGFGVLSGLRIGTHTKLVHENGDRKIDKDHGSTAMSPFKLDLMARIGWGKINLYGKYSLVKLFKNDRGPELFPFSVGISLVNW